MGKVQKNVPIYCKFEKCQKTKNKSVNGKEMLNFRLLNTEDQ